MKPLKLLFLTFFALTTFGASTMHRRTPMRSKSWPEASLLGATASYSTLAAAGITITSLTRRSIAMFTALIKSILDRWHIDTKSATLPYQTYLIYRTSFDALERRINNPESDLAELEKCLIDLSSLFSRVHAAYKTEKKSKSEDRPTRKKPARSLEPRKPSTMELFEMLKREQVKS